MPQNANDKVNAFLGKKGWSFLLFFHCLSSWASPELVMPLENNRRLVSLAISNLRYFQESNFDSLRRISCGIVNQPTPAEQGCSEVRNDSYRYSVPLTSTNDFFRVVNESGGMEKFRERFGLFPPSREQRRGPNAELPMGFTYNEDRSKVHFNCFLCHGQAVAGQSIEGGANQRLKMHELVTAFRDTPLPIQSYMRLAGSPGFAGTLGATTAFDLSITAAEIRSQRSGNVTPSQLARFAWNSLQGRIPVPVPVYAQPWWNNYPGLRSATFYTTGISNQAAGHLMQFALTSNRPVAELRELGPMFERILACVKSVPPPESPLPVDRELVEFGRTIYHGGASRDQNCNCAKCHGTTERGNYSYPELRIRASFIGTDRVLADRFDAATLTRMKQIMTKIDGNVGGAPDYEATGFRGEDVGYIAPPLVALFTKTGLLHNQSVPTVRDLLCKSESERPQAWLRTNLESSIFDDSSIERNPPANASGVYNTRRLGFSNKGHDFCSLLKEDPKACSAVVEYLKTL